MRRGLTAVILGATLGLGACGTARVVDGAGAEGYRAAPIPAATVQGRTPDTTAAPDIGGVPIVDSRLSSGATPAAIPILTFRGFTQTSDKKAPPTVALPSGGYEAETIVVPALNLKTKQPYNCTVAFKIAAATGAPLFLTAPQAPGISRATFVVGAPTTAVASGNGPLGCNWTLILLPA